MLTMHSIFSDIYSLKKTKNKAHENILGLIGNCIIILVHVSGEEITLL